MVIIAEMNVLAVGGNNQSEQFKGLPVHLLHLSRGIDAIRAFKKNHIDSVISHWHLEDMPNGQFLKKLKMVKPDIPTIAIIESNNPRQEIQARALGVNAVVCQDCEDFYFRRVMSSVFGLCGTGSVEKVYPTA